MKQLALLQNELELLQENINRVIEYKNKPGIKAWEPQNSLVVGELKHRMVALKQRLTIASSICTGDLFKND